MTLSARFVKSFSGKLIRPREVMTIIYMDEDMRLIEPKNKNQKIDWETWRPGAKVGEIINTPLNPVLYSW